MCLNINNADKFKSLIKRSSSRKMKVLNTLVDTHFTVCSSCGNDDDVLSDLN